MRAGHITGHFGDNVIDHDSTKRFRALKVKSQTWYSKDFIVISYIQKVMSRSQKMIAGRAHKVEAELN